MILQFILDNFYPLSGLIYRKLDSTFENLRSFDLILSIISSDFDSDFDNV